MATQIGRLSKESRASLVQYCNIILNIHQKMEEFRNKMEYIDIAYARYKAANAKTGDNNGVDVADSGDIACGINNEEITIPITVAQVDSYVSYWADIFLSGYPIFPVISEPNSISEAEKLQAIIDDHATRARYARQLLLSFKDDAKYNFSAMEIDWTSIDLYNVSTSFLKPGENKIDTKTFSLSKLKHIDGYNMLFDPRVAPVDIPICGEWAGYIEIISRIELKRRLAYFASTGNGYHTSQAMESKLGVDPSRPTPNSLGYYKYKPQISNILTNKNMLNASTMDWVAYLKNEKSNPNAKEWSDTYEFITLYARIIPEEHKISNVPRVGSPQVWKLCFVNHDKLVYAKRIFTIYDMLPIIVSQPMEDGFGLQTVSLGEGSIAFQEGASKLLSIRLNAARRAVMDRALYNPQLINPNDINTPMVAPKIPVRDNAMLQGKTLDDAYKQIPFDSRGTETVIQDMNSLSAMSDNLAGLNRPLQGQFQKGNKTRKEFTDTMEGALNRLRLSALMLELQKFLPLKEQIKLNIYQNNVTGAFQNMTSGEVYNITPEELEKIKSKVNNFKLADGFHPADRLASTDILVQGMQFIAQSQQLQQAYGASLPKMFAHMMSIGGVHGLDQYAPDKQRALTNPNEPQQ